MKTDPLPPTGLNYRAITASTLIKTGEGDLHLILCSSSTALSIRVWDSLSAAGTQIVGTMNVAEKEEYDIPAHFTTGLFVELPFGVGGITVFYI